MSFELQAMSYLGKSRKIEYTSLLPGKKTTQPVRKSKIKSVEKD